MNVVFQNQHLVAADKPSGMLTVPSRFAADDARPCLGRQLQSTLGFRLWPLHRLDFEVSGLVLFARTEEAHRIAGAAFEGRRVKKRYQALTEGTIETIPTEVTWESRIVRGKKRSFDAPHGKPARTFARVVARVPAQYEGQPLTGADELLKFELFPETGRPHQLRWHLASHGFPVVGDTLYGARTRLPAAGTIALRSVRIQFLDESDRLALGLATAIEVPGWPS